MMLYGNIFSYFIVEDTAKEKQIALNYTENDNCVSFILPNQRRPQIRSTMTSVITPGHVEWNLNKI